MCGIIGQISYNDAPSPLLSLGLLNHRGPDSCGEWVSPNKKVYLGHTRLAILDPSPAGHQPMHDSSGRFTIIFNGEIYNHLTLRKLIPNLKWKGNSDTETVIELISSIGFDVIQELKGMFAFALHDKENGSLLLVRDRFGIKPLWYKNQQDCFTFSSEIRALLPPGKQKFTEQALSEYVAFGRMPAEGEIVEGIENLSPGSWLKIDRNKTIKKTKWWPKNGFPKQHHNNKKDCIQTVKLLVSKAIEEHLISDVGIGSFLSGGIDSSIVTLEAGKILGDRLQTFTVGFPQQSFDERAIARRVSQKAGSRHSEIEVSPDACLSWVKEAVNKLDLPSVDAINTYIVSKAVRESGLKVALSGLGGDELFGGYPSFRQVPLIQLINIIPEKYYHRLLSVMPQSIREKLIGVSPNSTVDLTSSRRRFASVDSLLAMGLGPGKPHLSSVTTGLDRMGLISWAEIQSYMVPMLLRDSDQMSMAVGLEIRVPFLDHHLVEGVLGLPQKFKKGAGVKPLLVEAFRDELPKEVYSRPKQGFSLPMDLWIRGPLEDFTSVGIKAAADNLSLCQPIIQFESFLKGQLHWTRIWKWCVLGHWMENQNQKILNEVPIRQEE